MRKLPPARLGVSGTSGPGSQAFGAACRAGQRTGRARQLASISRRSKGDVVVELCMAGLNPSGVFRVERTRRPPLRHPVTMRLK
jgi:hypothetical protein